MNSKIYDYFLTVLFVWGPLSFTGSAGAGFPDKIVQC